MRVRMKMQILGARNGVRWPAPGEVKELPDQEGADLCAVGYAEPVVDDKVEKATPRKRSEKRG